MQAQTDGAKLGQRRRGETLKGVSQILNWKMVKMDARLEQEGEHKRRPRPQKTG